MKIGEVVDNTREMIAELSEEFRDRISAISENLWALSECIRREKDINSINKCLIEKLG